MEACVVISETSKASFENQMNSYCQAGYRPFYCSFEKGAWRAVLLSSFLDKKMEDYHRPRDFYF